MSERKISYLNRTYEDYRKVLTDYVRQNYPDMAKKITDASVGQWLIDMAAAMGDNLSYYIDRAYSETCIDSASMETSVYSIARTNGLKVPGPKGAIAQVEFSCVLPTTSKHANSASELGTPNWYFAPIVKKGTVVKSTTGQYFEVVEDVDFASQFNSDGESDRDIYPIISGNRTVSYRVVKKAVVTAGESKKYTVEIQNSMAKPFMEFVIPDSNVMSVESILFKDGTDYTTDPTTNEFMMQKEVELGDADKGLPDTYRFFEVDNLAEQYRWGDDVSTYKEGNQETSPSVTYRYGYVTPDDSVVETVSVTKGAWIPLTQKFVTEFTDKGYLKITFGSGYPVGTGSTVNEGLTSFSKKIMTGMVRNGFLGKTPKAGMTMFVLYRKGGGAASNVAAHTINSIAYRNFDIRQCASDADEQKVLAAVYNSVSVDNEYPSIGGKDAPTADEIRNMVKYNSAAQERCVTVKDYESRVSKMPPRYGCPFRCAAVEENNKVMMYILGVNHLGLLDANPPQVLITNIVNYLSMYRTINDYVEIKPGRIVNLSFEADIMVDRNYNAADVVRSVIGCIRGYMDINSHYLGEDVFIGDLEKEIGKTDGVMNLIDLRVYNEYGNGYSSTRSSQEIAYEYDDIYGVMRADETEGRARIDLDASRLVLNSDADEMFEIKYPNIDIRVRVMSR